LSHDLNVLEQRLKSLGPAWLAYDLRLMFSRDQTDGAIANAAQLARLTELPGRPPRSYRDFVNDTAGQWAKG
jgi:hypothetical protein